MTIIEVIYIPNLEINIMSTERLRDDNTIKYNNYDLNRLYDIKLNKLVADINVISAGLPTVTVQILISKYGIGLNYAEIKNSIISMKLAHRRLGHVNINYIQKLANGLTTDLILKTKQLDRTCDHYMIEKIKSMLFPVQETLTRSERPFNIIYINLLHAPVSALEIGYRYLWSVTDNWTRVI